MKKTFEKLAKVLGPYNEYAWMYEEGKIDEKNIQQFTFDELKDIFYSIGDMIGKEKKKYLLDLMAKKAEKFEDYFKMYFIQEKIGNEKEADYFLEMAKKTGTIEEWPFVFKFYITLNPSDKVCANLLKITKNIIETEYNK